MLRKKRKGGAVPVRPSRGSGTKHKESQSEEDNPAGPPSKRPQKQGVEDASQVVTPEQAKEPTYKVNPMNSASHCAVHSKLYVSLSSLQPVMSSLFTSNPEVPELPMYVIN